MIIPRLSSFHILNLFFPRIQPAVCFRFSVWSLHTQWKIKSLVLTLRDYGSIPAHMNTSIADVIAISQKLAHKPEATDPWGLRLFSSHFIVSRRSSQHVSLSRHKRKKISLLICFLSQTLYSAWQSFSFSCIVSASLFKMNYRLRLFVIVFLTSPAASLALGKLFSTLGQIKQTFLIKKKAVIPFRRVSATKL